MNRFSKTLLTLTLLAPLAQAEILMPWKRIPLPVDLHVNEERILFLDRNVQVGVPAELDGKIEVQSTGGAVYLKSKESFDLQRLQLRDLENGQEILVDLRSKAEKGKLDHVRITFDKEVVNNNQTVAQTSVDDPERATPAYLKSGLPAPAALTRYAAQSLYAPLRTVEPLDGVRRVAVKLPKSIPNLMPNVAILATPLESWELDGYVVTAIRIKNLSNERIDLDPRNLQGYFYSATFQHNWLDEKGTMEDTTVVYLVTEGKPDRAFIPFQSQRTKSTAKKAVRKQ